ncbi:MAG: cyclic nucleotide-binding domain-containing protein [Thermodesulfobacteriota bacterium]|nr:cyclic nucleotide-binding domain-containing protein [Thermodesulfobacteriota bacterium]
MSIEDIQTKKDDDTTKDISAIGVKIYKPKQTIIKEGDNNEYFFVILEGTAEVLQKGKVMRILKERDVFGVDGFFSNHYSTTTVRALSKTRIAIYQIDIIDDIIYSKPQLTERILASILNQLEQTTQIAEENIIIEGVTDLNEVVYEDGETIIKEGTTGYDFFRLLRTEGGLLATRKGKKIGKIEKTGEFFGEMSSILKQPRTATISSIGTSVVQVFYGNNLSDLIESYPKVARKLLDTLSLRLIKANKTIIELTKEK